MRLSRLALVATLVGALVPCAREAHATTTTYSFDVTQLGAPPPGGSYYVDFQFDVGGDLNGDPYGNTLTVTGYDFSFTSPPYDPSGSVVVAPDGSSLTFSDSGFGDYYEPISTDQSLSFSVTLPDTVVGPVAGDPDSIVNPDEFFVGLFGIDGDGNPFPVLTWDPSLDTGLLVDVVLYNASPAVDQFAVAPEPASCGLAITAMALALGKKWRRRSLCLVPVPGPRA